MILPSKEFLEVFKSTDGALSVCESIAIMNITANVKPHGWYIECGVYHGKSAMSAAVGLNGGTFFLVDPIFDDTNVLEIVKDNIWDANKEVVLLLISGSSINELHKHDSYDYVFIDSGDHQELPMQEVKILEDKISKNGIISFHDFNSQFLQVREAYDYLLSTGKYEEINIPWDEIVAYVKENDLEKGNKSWHHPETPFPCFVGAVKRK